jgi:hypothetical protein
MKIKREDWIFITGQADSGKTYWIKAHLKEFPKDKAFIYDFNRNDYQEFIPSQNLWQVTNGNQKEIEQFINYPYKKGNCYVVLEEADNYLLYPSEKIRKFVNTARNRGVGCMVSAKRAKACQPVYRTRFTHLVLFRCTIPEDIEYLESWAGTGKGSLGFIRSLDQGQHVIVDLQHQQVSDIKKL